MPSSSISQLPSLSAITSVDLIPVVSTSFVSSGETYKITYNTLSNGDYQLSRNKTITQSGFSLTFLGSLNGKLIVSEKLEQGLGNSSTGIYSHSQGQNTISFGDYSHSEGYGTKSTGVGSHAQGYNTESIGNYSSTAGIGTVAAAQGQSVIGKYNQTGNTTSLFVIGNGTSVLTRSDLALFNTTGLTINGNLIVTGTTNIRPYRVYSALLTQTGNSAPTAVVLENTLGFTPTWSYNSTGIYSINQTGAFPLEQTFVITPLTMNNDITGYYSIDNTNFPNTLYVKTLSNNDDSLYYSPIEIKIYF